MSNLSEIIKESFTQYAGAVLQSRALVDVRDCLKPSARQIFYCLYTDKLLPNKPFKKTVKVIGSAARMYIHGDSSSEGVIMRAGQPFAMRYPLIEVEGNEGSLMSSGNWAAPRYTSSRLSNFSVQLFKDIDKETITEWRDNYDDTEQYPTVLPTKGFYNIVNGTQGIGIGAASSIPQFNLKEVNQALEKLLLNPDIDFNEIYCAPDFATGAILFNEQEVKESLKNGQGFACKLRSVIEWDSKERCFIVTQIPYAVYTNTICGELDKILDDDNINPGIDRYNDLTGINPLIKIYLHKKANPDKVLRYLYKNTSLQSHFGINLTMLDQGRFPKVFTWKEALQAYIDHEKVVYRRGFEFDLKKIEERIHIIEGLQKAYDAIDEVIHIIKESPYAAMANINLQKLLDIDEYQARAILNLKLAKLSRLDIQKLGEEKEELQKEAARIHQILDTPALFNQELINDWRAVADKYGDARRTKILNLSSTDDEVTEKKQLSISITNKNAIFVSETSTLYAQRRNGVGTKFKLESDEYIIDNLVGENTDTLLLFTNLGNFYHLSMKEFVVDEKQYLTNFMNFTTTEHIVAAAINCKKPYIIFITKNGILKKSSISEYSLKRNVGATAIKLDKGDEIVSVLFVENEQIGIASRQGNFIRITTSDVNAIGRVTRGVCGMKLNEGDNVVCAEIIPKEVTQLVSITKEGYAKRTLISEFRLTGRATKGVKLQKTDSLVGFIPISTETDILVVSSNAQLRLRLLDIPLLSRDTQGVKAIKLSENSSIIKISKV